MSQTTYTVIQGEMLRVPVDLTVIICLGMKATKETSKGRGDSHLSNIKINTTI